MSYLAEAHRSTGDVITAQIWNQAVSDNVAYLYNAVDVTGKVGMISPFHLTDVASTAFTANRIYLTKWLLPKSLSMNYFMIYARTGSPTCNVGLGMYSTTGTLLVRSDATTSSSDASSRCAVTGGPVTVISQWVWLAATADDAFVADGGPFGDTRAAISFNEGGSDVQTGYSSTTSANGVLPAAVVVTGLTAISLVTGPHAAVFMISCV